jgi:hypothetical protein
MAILILIDILLHHYTTDQGCDVIWLPFRSESVMDAQEVSSEHCNSQYSAKMHQYVL